MIAGLQRQVEQFLGHHHLAVADQIKNRFNLMGEGGDGVETEHRPRTLDRVHGPKNPIDKIIVLRRLFKVEEGCFQFGEQFAGFFSIGGNVFFDHGPDPYLVV